MEEKKFQRFTGKLPTTPISATQQMKLKEMARKQELLLAELKKKNQELDTLRNTVAIQRKDASWNRLKQMRLQDEEEEEMAQRPVMTPIPGTPAFQNSPAFTAALRQSQRQVRLAQLQWNEHMWKEARSWMEMLENLQGDDQVQRIVLQTSQQIHDFCEGAATDMTVEQSLPMLNGILRDLVQQLTSHVHALHGNWTREQQHITQQVQLLEQESCTQITLLRQEIVTLKELMEAKDQRIRYAERMFSSQEGG